MTTPTSDDQPRPYKPSQELTRAIAEWREAVALEERLRHAARKAVAVELTTTGVTNSTLAGQPDFPWTEETVRGIAREYDTPRLRAPQTPRTPKTTRRPRAADAAQAATKTEVERHEKGQARDVQQARKAQRERQADDTTQEPTE